MDAATLFNNDKAVLAMFEETDSPGMTAGAFRGPVETLGEESGVAMMNQMSRHLFFMLCGIAAIAILLIPISKKLTAIIVNPVEQEQHRRELEILRTRQEKETIQQLDRLKTD